MPARLITCEACRRQIDVRHASPGTPIRCACGALQSVPVISPQPVAILACSHCGAACPEGGSHCSYCGALFREETAERAERCPECLARNPTGASFCCHCGVALGAHTVIPIPEGAPCPRCQGQLLARFLDSAQVLECGDCHGLWLTPEHFRQLCSARPLAASAGRSFQPAPDPHPVTYLPCLICDDFMVRKSFHPGSGVIIDVCRHHGVWVDDHEMSQILRFLSQREPSGA